MDVLEFARTAERLGFESLFHPEHTHIPVVRESRFPAGDGELPGVYTRNLDPFVALAAAAAVTSRIRLGTGVSLLAQRDPIVTAKLTASLDRVSGGRLLLGVGAGWNVEEMCNHQVDPDRRWQRVREHAAAIRQLWTQDIAEFHGTFVDLEPSYSWPKPAQSPHPPILVGGRGPRALDRVMDWGDGWLPALDDALEPLLAMVDNLTARCHAAERPCPPITVAYGPLRGVLPGELMTLAQAGVARCLLSLPELNQAEAFAQLHALADLARHELGQLWQE